jgi:hypothetical protein
MSGLWPASGPLGGLPCEQVNESVFKHSSDASTRRKAQPRRTVLSGALARLAASADKRATLGGAGIFQHDATKLDHCPTGVAMALSRGGIF